MHVDDLLMAYNDADLYDKFWSAFNRQFRATRGTVERYLGMEVRRDRDARRIVLTQTVYIEKLFSKYLPGQNTKAWTTPIDLSREGASRFYAIKAAESEQEKLAMAAKDYNGLIGSLLYAACMTRPDISYYTAYLCQFMQSPSTEAWDAALSIASYLNTTKELGIAFNADPIQCCVADVDVSTERLIVFSDASFGRDIHPFAGGFVQYRNGPLAWSCRKAKFVPLSTCEVEVFSVVMLLKEAEFASQIIEFLSGSLEQKTAAVTDNRSARDVIIMSSSALALPSVPYTSIAGCISLASSS